MVRFGSIKRWFAIMIVASLVIWGLVFVYKPLTRSQVSQFIEVQTSPFMDSKWKEHSSNETAQPKALSISKPVIDFSFSRTVLIFTEFAESPRLKKLKDLLSSQRISFDVITWTKSDDQFLSMPRLYGSKNRAKYGGFIFDNSGIYSQLDQYNKVLLHDYCKLYNFGIIILAWSNHHPKETEYMQYGTSPLWIKKGVRGLYNTELNPKSSVLEMTKAGNILECGVQKGMHSVFWMNHSTYEPVSYSFRDSAIDSKDDDIINYMVRQQYSQSSGYQANRSKFVTILHDKGELDGVRKVFFGGKVNSLWQYQLIFFDALSVLSRGGLGMPLKRWVLIDIDDIFVAHKGIRMKKDDVKALLESQERLAAKIPNFHFNLGFSGYYFRNGSPEENIGDMMLIENSHKFWWFPHMYKHQKPHKFASYESLVLRMKQNKKFAELHKLPIMSNYSVSPHHSGVYPVHEDLYKAWKKVWGVRVTSTEEYPHLYPSWLRRGFIHKDIMVLPRQTCGLFTQTLFWSEYPRGRQRLENSINGGELFMTFVNNPISIFMTHFGNYGNDRLATYTFEAVVDFIQKWTNLQLVTEEPMELGKKYFELFPYDAEPLWLNPCNDPRHLNIWAANKTCSRIPHFMIIGPQKTGTTALRAFISINPKFISNHMTRKSHEEVQFFNSESYLNGLDWYTEKFPLIDNTTEIYYFEKSANYFDSSKAYKRAAGLLPKVKLIITAINPIQRAYSWYQHVLSKAKPETMGHSFYDVITGKGKTTALAAFRRRCLLPGLYAMHLENWLSVYPPEQILIVDGDQLRYDPATTLNTVQQFLKFGKFNYKDHIAFSPKKGFFCPLNSNNKVRCLGKGKGRKYPKIDYRSEAYLRDFYRLPNLRLAQLLKKLKWTLPKWLKKEIEGIR